MGDVLRERLALEANKFITDHELWQSGVVLVGCAGLFVGAGFVLSWFYKRAEHQAAIRKAVAEVGKIAVETTNAQVELTLKRQANRKSHEAAGETLGMMLREWISAASTADLGRIDAAREEVLNFVCSTYVPTFRDYSEIQFETLPKDPRRRFAQNEVMPFLRTVLNLLDGINYPAILTKLDRAPFLMKRATLCEISAQAKRALPRWPPKDRQVFRRLCDGISKYEDDL